MSLGTSQDNAIPLIHEAIDLGINFFDTADLYDKGRNEEIVGKALKEKRNEIILATKVGNEWRADGSGWDWNPSKKYILSSIDKSLHRLQTDYIDLYQLHGGTIDDPIEETIEAFEMLKQSGKIRAYGISSIRPNVIREYVKRSHIDTVMMQYSLLDRRPEETCLSLLQQNNIGVLSRGALAQGLLAGKPAKAYLGHSAAQVETAAQVIKQLSDQDRTPANTALWFVLQNPAIASVITGIRTRSQLHEAVHTLHTSPMSATDLDLCREKVPSMVYTDHR